MICTKAEREAIRARFEKQDYVPITSHVRNLLDTLDAQDKQIEVLVKPLKKILHAYDNSSSGASFAAKCESYLMAELHAALVQVKP